MFYNLRSTDETENTLHRWEYVDLQPGNIVINLSQVQTQEGYLNIVNPSQSLLVLVIQL